MKDKHVNMLSGSITKGLLILTMPIMVMNMMQTVFNMIDMAILGRFADDIAVGGVGACGMLITLCTALLIGCSAGANVVVARHLGTGNDKRTENAVATSIVFSVLGGTGLAIIGVIFAETFLKWTNCPQELLDAATLYFQIYFVGFPFIMFYTFCAAILRAAGDTKRPMVYMILGGAIKVLLSLLFVLAFKMSVAGVAISTLIGNGIIGILSFTAILKMKDKLHFGLKSLQIRWTELKQILYIGLPSGIQHSLYAVANVVIQAAVNGFGPAATTGVSIANQFDGLIYNIKSAPALSVVPFVAQNVGAGNLERTKKSVSRALCITVLFGGILGALAAIFAKELAGTMSSTPEVIKFAQQKMIIVSSTYFISGINEVLGESLRGMGRPIVSTITTLIFMCLIRFPWVYFVFPLLPNLSFLYLIWPIGWTLSGITMWIVYSSTIRKMEKKAV